LTPSQYSLHRFAPIFSNFFSVGDDPHNLLRSPRILGARLLSHFYQSFRDRWIKKCEEGSEREVDKLKGSRKGSRKGEEE